MSEEELKYLEDIRMAIAELQEFIGRKKNFNLFNNNQMLKRATERQFEIIGEAIKNLNTLNSSIEIKYSKQIIGLRNRIIHSYDSIDYEWLWTIIIKDIPELKREIIALMKE